MDNFVKLMKLHFITIDKENLIQQLFVVVQKM